MKNGGTSWDIPHLFLRVEEIIGRHDFEADGDPTAAQMAQALFDVCSDSCQSFDLWKGSKHISVPRLFRSVSFAELSAASQERVIQTEEQIAQSEWLVAKSRRLLEYLETNGARRPARQRICLHLEKGHSHNWFAVSTALLVGSGDS
jgi:hypothetical protein